MWRVGSVVRSLGGVAVSGWGLTETTASVTFTAPVAGTYLYLDPLNAPVNRMLGLHGVMIVEPALRETARGLHQVRDRVLNETRCMVFSPCLHELACPALIKEDDWCHEERPWTPPSWVAEIDRRVGFIKDALKFAYVLLRKDGRTLAERSPAVFRVVSELRTMKGEQRAWLCNETGRFEVGRLDRAASDRNRGFDAWHRGAIVRIDEIV